MLLLSNATIHAKHKNPSNQNKNRVYPTIIRYQAQNCEGCTLRGVCHKSRVKRVIEVNQELKYYRQQIKQNLNSEKGIYHRKKRCTDLEPVFANIKSNHHFKRFMLRSKPKVEIETGLLALALNLRKKEKQESKKAA